MTKANNAFAFDLFARLRSKTGNIVFSPTSVFTALTMLWGGARSNTAAEMKRMLHVAAPPEQAMDVAGKVIASFQAGGEGAVLRIANRLFGEKSYAFEASYVEQMRHAFGASLLPLDFHGAADEARLQVNRWVSEQTEDRIKDLLAPGTIDGDTRLVLVNAIYLLADWMKPFEKVQTRAAAFRVTPDDAHSVPTMHHIDDFSFATTDGARILELPYAGNETALTIVLPDGAGGIDSLESRMKQVSLEKWISTLTLQRVSVALPKFQIEPTEPLALSGALQALGMMSAFDRQTADFTGIATDPDPHRRLYLSQVFHKAFIRVDEKGTEAAAATGALVAAGAGRPTEKVVEFRADHPFLFFLRHRRSGLILFMGRMVDPAST